MSALREAARCDGPRLPVGPLLAAAGDSVVDAAEALGVQSRQLYRWRHHGLTWAAADVLACRLGLHPAEIWPVDWWATD